MMNMTKLIEAIKELAPDMQVSVSPVWKGKVRLTGFAFGEGEIKPVLYMEHFESMYEKEGYYAVASEMLEMCKEGNDHGISERLAEITDWEYAKHNLRLCIGVKVDYPDCITYPFLDLELYVRVIVSSTEGNTTSYKVKEHLLNMWGITREQLLKQSINCTMPHYTIKTMGEMLYEMSGDEIYLGNSNILIGTTAEKMNGASIIYCTELLKNIANILNDDVIILPSSIHEVIFQPLGDSDLDDYTMMVQEINATEVAPHEVLSNHAYLFHRDTMEITW